MSLGLRVSLRLRILVTSTLPVIGFDYNFSAIQHEQNDLFLAYKDMFEIAVSRGGGLWDIVIIYFPWLESIFVSTIISS